MNTSFLPLEFRADKLSFLILCDQNKTVSLLPFFEAFQCAVTVQYLQKASIQHHTNIIKGVLKSYEKQDLDKHQFICLFSENRELIEQVRQDADKKLKPLFIPGQPEQSDFQLPIMFKNDELHVTVNYYSSREKSANLRNHIRELYENGKVVDFEPPVEH